jgi:hypothetical protein
MGLAGIGVVLSRSNSTRKDLKMKNVEIQPGFQMSEQDLLEMIGQVQSTLEGVAKAEANKSQKLSKAEESSVGGEKSASPSGSPEASAAPGGEPSMGAPTAEPSAPEASAAPGGEPSAAPGPEAGPGPGAGEGQESGPSFEDLVALYTQLPDEAFEAHAAALQQAAQSRGGAGGQEPAPQGAPPAPTASPSPSAPPPALKSEAKVKELEAKLAKLEKSLGESNAAIEGLGKVVTMPVRKAVTGLTFDPFKKTEPVKKSLKEMTRSELHKALGDKSSDPMTKSEDRRLINDFYQGNVGRESLLELFTK